MIELTNSQVKELFDEMIDDLVDYKCTMITRGAELKRMNDLHGYRSCNAKGVRIQNKINKARNTYQELLRGSYARKSTDTKITF